MDPWFSGSAFEGGWGLRFNNPNALALAQTCTHLWISHFHEDHFHLPTLKKLAELNPNIIVLGNNSYNFQLDEAVKRAGFKNVVSLFEREPFKLSEDFVIKRYPTTGIDNMLLINTSEGTILNYNDCSLPPLSQKILKKQIGEIDILLTNFNHAGKLLLYPYPNNEVVRKKLIECFSTNYKIFNPKYVLPFASYHYYQAKESFHQNGSMISGQDLTPLDPKIIPWKIGERIEFNPKDKSIKQVLDNEVELNTQTTFEHKTSYTLEQLKEAGNKFIEKLKKHYGPPTRLLPDLIIKISDLDRVISLSVKKATINESTLPPHIVAHSESLYKWFSKIYGTDSFVVGAHFDIAEKNRIPLKWQIVLGMLLDNKLDLRSLITMAFTRKGIKFLFHRKEEIFGILTTFRIAAEYHND
jgi:hypothetical protein